MKTTAMYETQSEVMKEVSRLIELNRFVSVRPAWVYNPEIANYDKCYIVESDCITQRSVEEIIGDKTIEELKAEIIEIQRVHYLQSYVTSELNKRYNATPDEINAMYQMTGTNVPRYYKSLSDYKMSGEWPGDIREKEQKPSNPFLFRIQEEPKSKTTKNKKK